MYKLLYLLKLISLEKNTTEETECNLQDEQYYYEGRVKDGKVIIKGGLGTLTYFNGELKYKKKNKDKFKTIAKDNIAFSIIPDYDDWMQLIEFWSDIILYIELTTPFDIVIDYAREFKTDYNINKTSIKIKSDCIEIKNGGYSVHLYGNHFEFIGETTLKFEYEEPIINYNKDFIMALEILEEDVYQALIKDNFYK